MPTLKGLLLLALAFLMRNPRIKKKANRTVLYGFKNTSV